MSCDTKSFPFWLDEMFGFVKETYQTYYNKRENRRERHWFRLITLALITLCVCLFSKDLSANLNNMMITGLTILTGFTFTALFSDHSLADVGLPKPRNENDKHDLVRLGVLATNFHVRSRYFIILSILDVCLLIVRSAGFAAPTYLQSIYIIFIEKLELDAGKISVIFSNLLDCVGWLAAFISIYIFLECLYTFYRLSETIISIVNMRRDYLRASVD